MTLSIDLPDNLIQQARDQQVNDEELKAVAIAAMEIWLARQHSTNGGRFAESAVPFTRKLVAENRELFEALAQR
jgi:hypothetical protein